MEKEYTKVLKEICISYEKKADTYEKKAKELVDLAWMLLKWEENEITITKEQLIELEKTLKTDDFDLIIENYEEVKAEIETQRKEKLQKKIEEFAKILRKCKDEVYERKIQLKNESEKLFNDILGSKTFSIDKLKEVYEKVDKLWHMSETTFFCDCDKEDLIQALGRNREEYFTISCELEKLIENAEKVGIQNP